MTAYTATLDWVKVVDDRMTYMFFDGYGTQLDFASNQKYHCHENRPLLFYCPQTVYAR
jgi:hypothetical protein